MLSKNRKFDTSLEQMICRVGNGIKLMRQHKKLSANENSGISIAKVMQLPVAVYFEDTAHKTLICNEITAEECGFVSIQDCVGSVWYRPFHRKYVEESLINDINVVQNESFKIVEEKTIRKDNVNVHTLSVRMPWYSDENKVIGLFGCSIVLGKHSLPHSLSQIAALGLFNTSAFSVPDVKVMQMDDIRVSLTGRETECFNLLVKGYSSKEIAKQLHISHRTVEQYQSNIYRKVGCKTKIELLSRMLSAEKTYSD